MTYSVQIEGVELDVQYCETTGGETNIMKVTVGKPHQDIQEIMSEAALEKLYLRLDEWHHSGGPKAEALEVQADSRREEP